MNKKANVAIASVVLVALFGWVGLGLVDVNVTEEKREISFNNTTKTNAQVIWCKMQGKKNCN